MSTRIENEKENMKEQIKYYPPYIYLKKCEELKSQLNAADIKFNNLQKFLKEKDENNSGLISSEDFFEIITRYIVISEEEKKIIIDEINRRFSQNSIENSNDILYQEFCDDVFKDLSIEMGKVEKEFNQKNNNYIRDIRNYIKANNVNIQETWSTTNNGSKIIDKDEFYNFILTGGIIDQNSQLSEDEVNYIFDILCNEQNILSLDDFEKIINYEPTFFQGSNSIIQQESHRLISSKRRSNFNSNNSNYFNNINNSNMETPGLDLYGSNNNNLNNPNVNSNITGTFHQNTIQFGFQNDTPLENIPITNSNIINDGNSSQINNNDNMINRPRNELTDTVFNENNKDIINSQMNNNSNIKNSNLNDNNKSNNTNMSNVNMNYTNQDFNNNMSYQNNLNQVKNSNIGNQTIMRETSNLNPEE
jgi:hypothetical protein